MTRMRTLPERIDIDWEGQRVALEFQWLNGEAGELSKTLVVFLHEAWDLWRCGKTFPRRSAPQRIAEGW